jgi:hypothetical protein
LLRTLELLEMAMVAEFARKANAGECERSADKPSPLIPLRTPTAGKAIGGIVNLTARGMLVGVGGAAAQVEGPLLAYCAGPL